MEAKNYRPANIEFDLANNSIVPDNLGSFETSKEAQDFIHKNLTAINSCLTTYRMMDNFEKSELRKDYSELLESKMPYLERELMEATREFEKAKKVLANAKEMVSSTTNEVKAIANEVKRGLKEIKLDKAFTWRFAYDSQYFFVTWIDKQLKIAKIIDIPDSEKQDLYNAMANNNEYFEKDITKVDFEDIYEDEKNKLAHRDTEIRKLLDNE